MAGLPPEPLPKGPARPGRAWTGWACSLALHAACLAVILGLGRFVAVHPAGGGGGHGGRGNGRGVLAVDLSHLGTGCPWPGDEERTAGADDAEAPPPEACQNNAAPILAKAPQPAPAPKARPTRPTPASQKPRPPAPTAATGTAPASAAYADQPGGGMPPGGQPGPGHADGSPGAGQGTGFGGGEGQGTGPGIGSGQGEGVDSGMDLAAVDAKPRIASQVEPDYPEAARRSGISGRVVARFLVTADGHVSRISIVSAQPTGIFDQSVLAALGKWKFRPARFKGREVAAWVMLPIRFDLKK